jgi:hypothetical protein
MDMHEVMVIFKLRSLDAILDGENNSKTTYIIYKRYFLTVSGFGRNGFLNIKN